MGGKSCFFFKFFGIYTGKLLVSNTINKPVKDGSNRGDRWIPEGVSSVWVNVYVLNIDTGMIIFRCGGRIQRGCRYRCMNRLLIIVYS